MKHHGLHRVKVHLSERQAHRLLRGHRIILKHKHLKGPHPLVLHAENAHKVRHARKMCKGVQLRLSHPEIRESGAGIGDWFKSIGDFYTQHIKPTLGPILKGAVSALKDTAVGAAKTAVPWLAPGIDELNQRYGQSAVDALGQISHAYGLRSHRMRRHKVGHRKISLKRGGALQGLRHPAEISESWSKLLNPQHPASWPHLPLQYPEEATCGELSYSCRAGQHGGYGGRGMKKRVHRKRSSGRGDGEGMKRKKRVHRRKHGGSFMLA